MKLIQILAAAAAIASLTGCASTKAYFVDRGRDAADIVTVTVGVGLGAKARVGFVQTGLLGNRDIVGLRSGQFFTSSDLEPESYGDYLMSNSSDVEAGPVMLLGLPLLYLIPDWGDGGGAKTFRNYCSGNDQFRLTGLPKERGKEIDSASWVLFVIHDSPQHLGQIEVVVGVIGSVRVGLNAGEFADLLLGWFGIDLFDDDIEMKKLRPKSNKTPDATR